MITEDYLMRMLLAFFKALVDSQIEKEKDPQDEAEKLDTLVGEASGLDTQTFLSLAPESIALILQSTGTDPEACEFIARSLQQSGKLRTDGLGNLRDAQAQAIADAYGLDISTPLDEFLQNKSSELND